MSRRLVRSASLTLALGAIASAQSLDQYTIFASQSAVLMDRSACLSVCLMGSGGQLRVGADAMVDGDVNSVGQVDVANRGRIQGTLTTAGSVTQQIGSSIGIVKANTPVSLPSLSGLSVAYGATDINIYNGQSLDLAPGSWGNIHVYAGGSVRLVGGVYQVRSLTMEADAKVNLDVSAGEIDFRTAESLNFGDRSQMTSVSGGNEYKVKWYSAQAGQLRIGTDVTFRGILTAPVADVSVASRCSLFGGLRARTVSLEPDSRILRVMKPAESNPVFTTAPKYTEWGTGTDIEFYCPKASDPKGLPVTIALVSTVENLKQNPNGCLQFSPKRWQDNKVYPVQLKATNSAGYSAFQDFKLTTFSLEHAYYALGSQFLSVKAGTPWSYRIALSFCANLDGTNNRCDVETVDVDGDVVDYQYSGLPGTATVSNRTVYWTPTAADVGKTYSLVLRWSDLRNGAYSQQTIYVKVTP